jgi:hypothetical protein
LAFIERTIYSLEESQRFVMKLRRDRCEHPAIRLHRQFVSLPVGDTASPPITTGTNAIVVVWLEVGFKYDVAITQCEQIVEQSPPKSRA